MKRSLLAFLGILLPFVALAAPVAAPGPEADWEQWRDKEYQGFRETLFNNPFTLQDVIELKAGEKAYLALPKAPKRPRWAKVKPPKRSAELSFDGKKLSLSAGKVKKETLVESKWAAPNGLGISGSAIRKDLVKAFVYSLKENTFTPALMPYFPFDAAAVVKAKLDRAKKNERAQITTTLGDSRPYPIAGELKFTLYGKEQALQAYVPEPTKSPRKLFIPFKDETNGQDTYGGGRYVEAELGTDAAGEVMIDFNRAYHPYCLYSIHFNCPVVLSNRVSAAVKAGAMMPASLKH
ncbi:MAG: DUF1684 domain-containing protein [Proteobacteria bacterium]|nr:MAG: DUF1684 domain-containing protein [Pseudomonadota bacterium]